MYYPWQLSTWQLLLQQFHNDCLAHAFIFYGQSGLGKLHFAKYFARFLLCEKIIKCNLDYQTPCEQCKSCLLFKAGTHPYFFELTLLDKAANIKVEQVRGIITELSKTISGNGRRVVLVYPADALNISAANAFLKTLEETLGETYIILLSDNVYSLIPTIISRCQKIFFSNPDPKLVLPWLQNSLSCSLETAQTLLCLSHDAPLKALANNKNNIISLRNKTLELLISLLSGNELVTDVAAVWYKNEVSYILRMIHVIVMEILKIKLGVSKSLLTNLDIIEKIQNYCWSVKVIPLAELAANIVKYIAQVQEFPGINQQLLLERVLFEWQSCTAANI